MRQFFIVWKMNRNENISCNSHAFFFSTSTYVEVNDNIAEVDTLL